MFDILVMGIDPKRAGEIEDIKRNLAAALEITDDYVDLLISAHTNPVCIQENVPEDLALKVCDRMIKLGLICIYQPQKTSRWGELSLVTEEDEAEQFFTCPVCETQQELVEKKEPKICPNCQTNLEIYRKEQQDQKEYAELRESLLRKSQVQQELQEREKLKEAEKLRKEQMEAQIAQELGLDKKPKTDWKAWLSAADQKQLAMIAAATALVIGLAIYLYSSSQTSSTEQLSANMPEQAATPPATASNPAPVAAPQVNTATTPESAQPVAAAVANTELPTQADIVDTAATANGQQLVVAEGDTPAQAALGEGYANVSKFMNSIGLKPDNIIAQAAKSPTIPATTTQPGAPTIPTTAAIANPGANSADPAATASPELTQKENSSFLDSMYNDTAADLEWQAFLSQSIKQLIKAGRLKSAYTLSQKQTELTDEIAATTELLVSFAKLGRIDLIDPIVSKLQQKIQALAPEWQAIYCTQLALNYPGIANQQAMLDAALKQTLELSDPIKQGLALSKIALYEKNAGLVESANKHFMQAEEKLKTAAASLEQFNGLIALAHNLIQSGNKVQAEIAMILAELNLTQLDAAKQSSGFESLLSLALSENNPSLIDKYSARVQSATYISKVGYLSVKSQLKDKLGADVAIALSKITNADYAAVATATAALLETDPGKQKASMETAKQKLALLTDNERKALAGSKLARYTYRLNNSPDALALFDQALIAALGVENQERRDAVLISLAMDKARVFLGEGIEQIIGLIHDENLKTAVSDMVKNTLALKMLAVYLPANPNPQPVLSTPTPNPQPVSSTPAS